MPQVETHPTLLALSARALETGDYYKSLGKLSVANEFYNLLPLIADVRKAWAAKENERVCD